MASARGHYHPDNASHPNAVPVHQAMGEHIQRQTHHNAIGDNIGPATWSSAPYVPPKPKAKKATKREADDGDTGATA